MHQGSNYSAQTNLFQNVTCPLGQEKNSLVSYHICNLQGCTPSSATAKEQEEWDRLADLQPKHAR